MNNKPRNAFFPRDLLLRASRFSALLLLLGPAAVNASGSEFDLRDLDTSVRAGDDFDAYASGGWRTRVTIPPDKQEVGTVDEISDRTDLQIRQLVVHPRGGTQQAKTIAALYAAFMDSARVEHAGPAPLLRDIDALRRIKSKEEMAAFMGSTQHRFGMSFFQCNVWLDLKNPQRTVLRVGQSGLGLGHRESYFAKGAQERLTEYRKYIARTLSLLGWPEPARAAESIVRLENEIAKASWALADDQDRIKRYNPLRVGQLAAFAPGFPWRDYLKGVGAPQIQSVIALEKSAFPALAGIFARAPLDTLKSYEAFHIADQASDYLPARFVENRFSFRGKIEYGMLEQEPRWKRGVALVNDVLADAVGHEYVARYFSPRTKAFVEAMAKNFKRAFKTRIEKLSWMSPETKAAALAKLKRVRVLIGYPAKWRNYSGLRVTREDLYGDVLRARALNWKIELGKLSRPMDRDEWYLPAQAIDAFSDQPRVQVAITAGLLQRPLLDAEGDLALNYGGIGEAIGHELTHQFDDQGRQYDAAGALRDWWTPQDVKRFREAAAGLATQYGAYEVLPGLHINGRQTLSENIADVGGEVLALDAYHLALQGKPAPVIDGLTGDQRFFLAWARVFRTKERPEMLRQQALEGTHTTFRFRAMGPARNIPLWYRAFDVTQGERLYLSPNKRVLPW